MQWRLSLHCLGNWAGRPHARLPPLGPFPSRRRRAWPSRALQRAPSVVGSPAVRGATDPRLPVTPIRRGTHVCSLHLCLYFRSANEATYKMAQAFQFSHHYTPAILFRVRMCRASHLSCGSPSFSMEIVCIFVKFRYLWFLMSWDTSSKNCVVVYTWNEILQNLTISALRLKNTEFLIHKWLCRRRWAHFQNEWWLSTPQGPSEAFSPSTSSFPKTLGINDSLQTLSHMETLKNLKVSNFRRAKKWLSLKSVLFSLDVLVWTSYILLELWQGWSMYLSCTRAYLYIV